MAVLYNFFCAEATLTVDSVSVGPVIAAGNKDSEDHQHPLGHWNLQASLSLWTGSLCFGLKRLVEAILGLLDVGA